MKDFHYNDPARSLGAATPTMSSLKNFWTRKSLTCSRKNNTHEPQARRGRNLYNFPIQGVEHLWPLLLITKITLTTSILEDEYINGKAQAYVRKQDRFVEEKLKKSFWKTQEKYS